MSLSFFDLKSHFLALDNNICNEIDRIFNHRQFIMGPEVAELEHKLSIIFGVKFCTIGPSGKDAMLISLTTFKRVFGSLKGPHNA